VKSIVDLLNEEVRPDVLYHAIRWTPDIVQILADNELKATVLQMAARPSKTPGKTFRDQFKDKDIKKGHVAGVSLTRSRNLAQKWGDIWGKSHGVILKLDRAGLKQNYKIIPYSWLDFTRHEAEEFVVGPIKNLDRYLLGIYTKEDSDDKIPDELFNHKKFRGNFF